jgi:hypothetical protein
MAHASAETDMLDKTGLLPWFAGGTVRVRIVFTSRNFMTSEKVSGNRAAEGYLQAIPVHPMCSTL